MVPGQSLSRSPDLQDFRGQRHYLHELLGAQFPRHRAEYTGPDGLVVLIDDDNRVLVEPDIRAVGAPCFLPRAHNDGANDIALLDLRVEDGFLDIYDDNVADAGRHLVRGPYA